MPRYAAVDIGSNSVRMMAAEVNSEGTRILAEDRQVTRLGESVFRSGEVSADALDFLCVHLARMSAIYAQFEPRGVRAVATSAVRDSRNQKQFLERTSAALGTSVEIISGPEEARLIHLGVESRWPRPKERTLIIDVGGGSAELIVSQGGELIDAVSRPLGAVRLTEVFLSSDPPAPAEIQRLFDYVDEKLLPFQKRHAGAKFDRAIATSATAAALVCGVNKVPRAKRDSADRLRARTSQLRELYLDLSRRDVAARRKIVGIGPRRAEIVVAGAAIFLRALELFQHHSLYYCAAGVRDGIIADLAARGVGRELSELSPQQREVVVAMAKRYGVALKHARHVALLAGELFEVLQPIHQLPPHCGKLLEAAAYLHDIGHFVSGTGHHKHSSYLVANSDMPGFTAKERDLVAGLCRFHRKSMPQPRHAQFQALDLEAKRLVICLAPMLRIADALDRGHEQKVNRVTGLIKNGGITLSIDSEQNADLELWAASEAAEVFHEVYALPVYLQRARAQRA